MPPLPDELARFTSTEGEHRALKMFVLEYGQACREAALLDAMNATLPFGKVGIVIASAIRSLK